MAQYSFYFNFFKAVVLVIGANDIEVNNADEILADYRTLVQSIWNAQPG